MHFNERLPHARKAAKARAGVGWFLFGPELQNALVCRELVAQLSALDCDDGSKLGHWSSLATSVLSAEEV